MFIVMFKVRITYFKTQFKISNTKITQDLEENTRFIPLCTDTT